VERSVFPIAFLGICFCFQDKAKNNFCDLIKLFNQMIKNRSEWQKIPGDLQKQGANACPP
jgi:hypothetical protein